MKIVKEFVTREIAGEYVLVPAGATSQEFNGMLTMSETAKFIWENIEKAESLEEMTGMITKRYDIDEETAIEDTLGFINALLDHGLIACTKEDKTW